MPDAEKKEMKIVFNDAGMTKIVYGEITFEEPGLVKIIDRNRKTMYINKGNIIFIKELEGRMVG